MSNGGFRLELNRAGVAALLKSPEMEQGLVQLAQDIRSRCEGEYEVYKAQTRVVVETASQQAYNDNSDRNTLLKAVSSSRGVEGVHTHTSIRNCRAIRFRRKQ